MTEVSTDAFYLGDRLIEPSLHRITTPAGTQAVEPKVVEVLIALAQTPGEVVTREFLLEKVWAGTVVTDHALTRAVSELRRVLDDNTRAPVYIETIPKSGYRLIAPVVRTHGDSYGATADVPLLDPPTISTAFATVTKQKKTRSVTWPWVLGATFCLIFFVFWRFFSTPAPTPDVVPHTTPLTSDPGRELSPVFSPDGNQVAYIREQDGVPGSNLFVRLIDSETPLQLTDGPTADRFPAWAPDGRRIAFLRSSEGECGVYLIPALGGLPQQIMPCPSEAHGLVWTPDGTGLITSARATLDGPRSLFRLDVTTGTASPITNSAFSDSDPQFSPDGSFLSFVRSFSPAVSDLFVMAFSDTPSSPERITSDHASIAGHGWLPNGHTLVFSSDRLGVYRFWQTTLDGDEIQPFDYVSAWDPGYPIFAASNHRMVYVEWFYQVNLWRLPILNDTPSSPNPEPVLSSTRNDYHPAFRADGTLAFVSNRSGSSDVWMQPPDEEPVRLFSQEAVRVQTPEWSPDGTRLLFSAIVDGQSDIFMIETASGQAHQLTHTPAREVAPTWTNEGQAVMYTSIHEGHALIKEQSLDTSPATVLLDRATAVKASSDGKTLFFSRSDTTGLWRYDRDSEIISPIFSTPRHLNPTHWQVMPRGIYYLAPINTTYTIRRINPETGTDQLVSTLPHSANTSEFSFAVSPDESWLYYTQRDRNETDLMMVEDLPF